VVAAQGLEAAVDEGDHRRRPVERAPADVDACVRVGADAIRVDALAEDRRAAAEGLREHARLKGGRGNDPVRLGEGHRHGGVLGMDAETLLDRQGAELRVEADIGAVRAIVELGVKHLLRGGEDLAQEHRLSPAGMAHDHVGGPAGLAQPERGLRRRPAPDQIRLGPRRGPEDARRRAALRHPAQQGDAGDLATGARCDRPAGVPPPDHRRRDESELSREVVVNEQEVRHAVRESALAACGQRPRKERMI